MKPLTFIGLLLFAATTGLQLANAQVVPSDPITSPFHAGVRVSYLENYHQTDAEIVAGCPVCGNFSNGTGGGFQIEGFGEVPFNFYRRLDLTFGLGFAERGGAFGQTETSELPILYPNSNTYGPLT